MLPNASECFGSDQDNCSTSSRAATCPALGGAFDCAAGVVALHQTKHTRNPDPRPPPSAAPSPPTNRLCFRGGCGGSRRGPALDSLWLDQNGRLGAAHRWRNLLVVEERAAEDFLAVRPLPMPGADDAVPSDGGAP